MPPAGDFSPNNVERRRQRRSHMPHMHTKPPPERSDSMPHIRSPSELNRLLRRKKEDSNVRRGAEIIRQEFQRKLDAQDEYKRHAERVREKVLSDRKDPIFKSKSSVVSDDEDLHDDGPSQQNAELKWKSALGDGDASTADTSGDEGITPFWRRAAVYEGAMDLISKGRKLVRFRDDDPAHVTRPQSEFLLCAVPCTAPEPCSADGMEGGIPFHNEWSGDKQWHADFERDDDDTYGSASEGFTEDFDVDASGFHTTDSASTTSTYLPASLQRERDEAIRSYKLHVIEEGDDARPPMFKAEKRQSSPGQDSKVAVVSPTAETDFGVPSPVSAENTALRKDPAYRHAQNAGFLWQSLVGQHIRFPAEWWGRASTPPMGARDDAKWQYLGRYKVRSNKFLNESVLSRAAPGRLLLHIVVQDLMTWRPVQDVVIGCFHPNARGIRRTNNADSKEEMNRDIWLAVRRRSGLVSAVESLLMPGTSWEQSTDASPLGPRQKVANNNVRAVFGEEPPVETVFVLESDLYQRLSGVAVSPEKSPPLTLLEEYVFA